MREGAVLCLEGLAVNLGAGLSLSAPWTVHDSSRQPGRLFDPYTVMSLPMLQRAGSCRREPGLVLQSTASLSGILGLTADSAESVSSPKLGGVSVIVMESQFLACARWLRMP